MINSYHAGFMWSDTEQAGALSVLRVIPKQPVVSMEYLDQKRFGTQAYLDRLLNLMAAKFAGRKFAAFLALDDPALEFCLKLRPRLDLEAPIVFCGINNLTEAGFSRLANTTGIAENVDAEGTIRLVLRLQPSLKRMLVLHGHNASGSMILTEFQQAAARVGGRASLEGLPPCTYAEIVSTLEGLSPDCALVLAGLGADSTGKAFTESADFFEVLRNRCRAPVYSVYENLYHAPVVGGCVLSPFHQGAAAAGMVARLLDGESMRQMPPVLKPLSKVVVDYQQMKIRGLLLGALPPNAEILNQPTTMLERHPWLTPTVVAALLLLVLGIFLLSSSLHKQKRVEEKLQLDQSRLEAMLKLTQLQSASLPDIARFTVEVGVKITRSGLGYLAVAHPSEPVLTLLAWSDSSRNEGAVPDKPITHPITQTGLWSEAVRQRKPTIANDYNDPTPPEWGLPPGHAAVRRLMTVPVLDDGRVVAVAGVGNKAEPYDQNDVRELSLLLEGMWHIVKRKQAEEALKQSEARLVQSQRIGKVGSWELDMAAQTLHWSAETYRIFGKSAAAFEPARERFYALVHPEDRAGVRARIEAAIQDGIPYGIDHRIVREDGSQRLVHEQAELVRSETGAPVRLLGTVQDITEQKGLEDQYRQAQKMEAVGQLAGGIAHDFNNILTVIKGHVSLLLAHPKCNEECSESLRTVESSADRAADLTRQLLAFSRRQVLQVALRDLNEILENELKMLQRLLGETVQIAWEPAKDPPLVEADLSMIQQVIINLAINARDAMPEGGRLTLRTRQTQREANNVPAHPEARSGRFAVLEVTDTGCGMDSQTRHRIFEPFFTTKEVGKGTGLGLAMVYGIVKQHNGWIEVASAPGQGSTFTVFLPASEDQAPRGMAARTAAPVVGGRETILAVEDEVSVRSLVRLSLQRLGYRVLEAGHGQEALALWRQHRDSIDLLLTDQVMPEGLSGRELAARLLAEKPHLKVIYSSGYSMEMLSGDLKLVEGLNYLAKPYAPAKLAQAVRACLDAPASSNPALALKS